MNNPLPQLCLFSDQEMQALVELPAAPAADLQLQDPGWLAWQLMIGEGLKGKAYRMHRRMFFSGKKRRSRNATKQ